MVHSVGRALHTSSATVSSLDARLHSLSPLAVLDRGYALVLTAEGGLIRSATQVTPGDKLTTRLSDGAFTSRVESAQLAAASCNQNKPKRKSGLARK
jgi:exodeoxyribonuclease VII large subunit